MAATKFVTLTILLSGKMPCKICIFTVLPSLFMVTLVFIFFWVGFFNIFFLFLAVLKKEVGPLEAKI